MKRYIPALIAALIGTSVGTSIGFLIPARVPPRVQIVDVPAAHSTLVWVNTKSGIFHRPHDRWYGQTTKGKYMAEDAAVAAGYRPAMN